MRPTARLSLLLLLPAILVTPGCGERAATGFRVALIAPGPISDDGWNATAYDGLLRIEQSLGATVREVQVKSPSEFEGVFRDFGRSGYALVFAHGFEFCETARQVAPEFPATVFCVTTGTVELANVSSIQFAIEQPAELAGVLAARLSQSGRIGCVGGVEIPPVKSAFAAFERGVQRERPDAQVVIAYVGSWEDVSAARQQSLALLDQGIDLLFHNADAAGLGVINAAEERGVLAIGCNKDQSAVKPDTVVASVVLDVPESFQRLAREVREGSHQGAIRRYDLKSGVVSLAYNPQLAGRIDEATRAAVERVRLELLAE